jgi:hypothetical protein
MVWFIPVLIHCSYFMQGIPMTLTPTIIKNTSSTNQGFALVIALSLMAFVLLLLLSITTLVQVETKSAGAQLVQLEARMNAKLGAMIALGDLQRYTGPDQRITARSDILVDPSSTPLQGQGRWTGVWSSKADLLDPADAQDGLNSHEPVWLVSGDAPDSSSAVDVANSVDLATVGRSVSDKSAEDKDDSVRVEPEPIVGTNNSTSGRYAYWVSDEGVKARVNLEDPYRNSADPDADYYRHAVPQQGDATVVSDSGGAQPFLMSNSLWKTSGSRVGQIASVKNISQLLSSVSPGADSESVNREYFHDFSVSSKSVLANTKEGGLRRDLSSALDASTALPVDLTGPMFEPVGGIETPGNPGGPKWEQLADYYQLAQSGGAGPVQFRMPTNDQVGIAPVVTRWNYLFHAFAGSIPGGDEWSQSGYEYSLGVFPLITLWNPYDQDLVLPKIGVEVEIAGDAVLYEESGSTTEVTSGPLLAMRGRYRGDTTSRHVIAFVIEGVTIPAGRAMNFSPPVNSYINLDDPSDNVLAPGAGGSLVNGFFTDPKPGISSADFLMNAGAQESWMHKFRRTNPVFRLWTDKGISLYSQVVNLYDLSSNSNFDKSGVNRFKSLTFDGINAVHARVIRLNRSTVGVDAVLSDAPNSFSGVIAGQGSSVGAAYSLSTIDLEEFAHNRLCGWQCGISAVLKFPEVPFGADEMAVNLLRDFNPTAPIVTSQVQVKHDFPDDRYTLYTTGAIQNSGWLDTSANYLDGADTEYSSVGLSNNFAGSERMVLYEIPQQAPLGIGQLMHANLMHLSENPDTGVSDISNGSHYSGYSWEGNIQQPYAAPTYAIGNSQADAHIPLGDSSISFSGYSRNGVVHQGAHYDYSYALNDLLWDQFYFSGIDVNSPVFPLPNSRLEKWKVNTSNADLVNEKQAAAHLMLDGGFNINSTSVAAWESILGAMREIDTLGTNPSDATQLHNFSRFTAPIVDSAGSLPSVASDRDAIVAGFRNLTDLQVTELATQIVDEIRRRCSTADSSGARFPFLSLSQFINRSLDTSTPSFAYRGALQSAIDQTVINGEESSVNGLWEPADVADYPNYAEGDLSLEARPLTEGMLGFLTQADVLNKIGPIIQARSDTFTIRSYGSVDDSLSGDEQSRVYYEIVVQRTPAYVDESDLDYAPTSTSTNLQFGRRYEIVSERWLHSDEI